LLLGIGAIVAITLSSFIFMAYSIARREVREDLDRLLHDKGAILSRSLYARDLRIPAWLERELEPDRLDIFFQVFDSNGVLRSSSRNLPGPLPLSIEVKAAAAERLGPFFETTRLESGSPVRVVTWMRGEMKGGTNAVVYHFVQAGSLLTRSEGRLNQLLFWLIIGAGVALAGALFATHLLLDQFFGSVDRLSESARGITTQTLARRLEVSQGDSEFSGLAQAINQLLDSLEKGYNGQQRFTADASHELRTPLTILRGEIDVALRRERTAAEYREVLLSSREEIERLSTLAENLLALARVDAGETIGPKNPVDLSETCRAVMEKLQPLAQSKKVNLRLQADQIVSVPGDHVRLEQAVFNLAQNAIHYTPPGEDVCLSVIQENGVAKIIVRDQGVGISAQDLPRVFERFYRVDHARTREVGGAGLGLPLVKTYIEAHGGSVDVQSELGKGSTFTILLPRAERPKSA
jgi:heavy metal sensor kinase